MKKTVFLTGATGNMGWAGFKELLKKKDRFQIRIIARDSEKNRKKLAPYMDEPAVEMVWGDLMNLDDVKKGVAGADFVIHMGGMVSPAADYFPDKTLKTNVTSAENLAAAVLAQPNADKIKVVYIGSVAQYGNRMGEMLWGRAGDPQRASLYDMYSVSKCKAEKVIVDSGIKTWVSLRQSGILYASILKQVNPTAFHVPVRGGLEWATIEDSGRLVANIVEDSVPDEFWNRFYNISSGEQYRMSNYEFESRLLNGLGLPGPEKVFEPQWFATKNFHGMWYTDADVLENYLHFRANVPVDEYFASLKAQLPWFYKLAFLAPAWAVRMGMKPYAFEKKLGTQYWVDHDPERMKAYFGSLEEYRSIVSWEQIRPGYMEKNLAKAEANGEIAAVSHGYDESKSIYELTDEEISAAAAFRGGEFLGAVCGGQDASSLRPRSSQYKWRCEHGHEFTASLEYVLLGGGWCPECGYLYGGAEDCPENSFVKQILD